MKELCDIEGVLLDTDGRGGECDEGCVMSTRDVSSVVDGVCVYVTCACAYETPVYPPS